MSQSSSDAYSAAADRIARVHDRVSEHLAAATDIELLAYWLDEGFRIPGTKIRFGFDSLIGLVPVAGDFVGGVLGAYIIMRAHALGAPKSLLARMAVNVAFDALAGSFPIVGDILDVAIKSNKANVRLLMAHLRKTNPQASARTITVPARRQRR